MERADIVPEPIMIQRKIELGDGRYLIFYEFEIQSESTSEEFSIGENEIDK